MSNLLSNAMLISLILKSLSNRKLNRAAQEVVATHYNAEADAGRFSKLLLEPELLAPIQAHDTAVRRYYYQQTAPWSDEGKRLLPSASHVQFMKDMEEFRVKRQGLVIDAKNNYPAALARAPQRLGGLFVATDYPTPEEFEAAFEFTLNYGPVPDASHMAVKMAKDQQDKIYASIERQQQEAIKNTTFDIWKRMSSVVDKIATTLSNPEAKFKDSLIGNLAELCDTIPALNLGDDPEITKLNAQLRAKLAKLDPEDLRKLPVIRQDAALAAQDALAAIQGRLGLAAGA